MTAALVIEMTIGLVVMAGTVQADPIFINTCPVVISSPGDYLLAADLICSNGGFGAILIASSDVTLKLEGHRITAGVNPAVEAINVQVAFPAVLEHVRILGPGLITNFLQGVELFFANNSEVSGVTVLGSGAGSIGIGAFGCNFLTLTANTVGRTQLGIVLTDINSSTISKNDASGNSDGIDLVVQQTGSTGNTVSHNILNGNTMNGLLISRVNHDLPLSASVQNNVTNGNGVDGITIIGLTGPVEVTNNTSLANGTFDLSDDRPGCSPNVWSGNTFFTANQSCIH
jgi:parallel beta-helix repeat protein